MRKLGAQELPEGALHVAMALADDEIGREDAILCQTPSQSSEQLRCVDTRTRDVFAFYLA